MPASFPLPPLTCTQEERVHELDEATGASLKLSILNPRGRIWTMVAGGWEAGWLGWLGARVWVAGWIPGYVGGLRTGCANRLDSLAWQQGGLHRHMLSDSSAAWVAHLHASLLLPQAVAPLSSTLTLWETWAMPMRYLLS